MSSINGFPNLKSSKEFSFVYRNSKKIYTKSAVVFYMKSTYKRVGFVASERIGGAVKRNFSKRRLRALFRELSSSLTRGVYIFVAKRPLTYMKYSDVKNSITYSFARMNLLIKK